MKTAPRQSDPSLHEGRLWDEDPRYQDAQFRVLIKFLGGCFPLAIIASFLAGSLEPLKFYAGVVAVFAGVMLLWLIVATVFWVALKSAFWLLDRLPRHGGGR